MAASAEDLARAAQQMQNLVQVAMQASAESSKAVKDMLSEKAARGDSLDMARILAKPEAFGASTREEEYRMWHDWWWSVRHYMISLNRAYEQEIKYVENNLDTLRKFQP